MATRISSSHSAALLLVAGLGTALAVAGGACARSNQDRGGVALAPPDAGFSSGLGFDNQSPNPPLLEGAAVAADPPPAISGGTLAILPDGVTAVAADPDRDLIAVANLSTQTRTATIPLQHHDEPGRLVADAAGHVHVILRRGGALVTIDPVAGTVLARRTACPLPRGVAYDPATDLVHVACMGGELVSFPAKGGAATRTLHLPRDLRDIVVDGSSLLVSQFRSAQVLVIDAGGNVVDTIVPPAYAEKSARQGETFTPSTAWRMRPHPGGGAVLLHQRGTTGTVIVGGEHPTPMRLGGAGGTASGVGSSGYGSGAAQNPCDVVVHPALTPIARGTTAPQTPPILGMVLPVDFAISSDGTSVAIIAAGNAHNQTVQSVFVSRYGDLTDDSRRACCPDGVHGPSAVTGSLDLSVCPPPATPPTSCLQPNGEAEAVGFDGANHVVIQTREPAALQMPDLGVVILLSDVSRADFGHELFHANTGEGIACASCHAEGQEDGRTWNFDTEGPRRTMNVAGGIGGRAPYHWDGELSSFTDLLSTVYQHRMGGPLLQADQVNAAKSWLNAIPRLPGVVNDPDAVARGQAVFNDPTHGCALCHLGTQLTNDATNLNVGTGGSFKVPSLIGLAYSGPYLHNGCAATLADRFGPCGGGDQHGITSTLTSGQLADLIAYLDSL